MDTLQALVDGFLEDPFGGPSLERSLAALLEATAGRAAGLWSLSGNHLQQLAFAAVSDMPEPVAREFRAATASVSLDQEQLGIVRAAMTRTPAVAHVDPARRQKPEDLVMSAGWLERFGAESSLSVPILARARTVGVLAVSSRGLLETDSPGGRLLLELAPRLEPLFAAREQADSAGKASRETGR